MTVETASRAASTLDADQLHHFLYQMVFIRRFEERSAEMYTKGKIRGFLHLYIGEEACGVGAINALAPQDKIITHYRDHGHAIVRGVDPHRIMAELFGRSDGTSGGRGGSMHIFEIARNFLGGHGIVGGHMPVAVGLGLAAKKQKQDSVTMCIFGDGAVGEGEFHEALNLSSIWKVPVVWFCENNGYGMGVPLKDSLANDVFRLASAYNMPAIQVDGMDVIAVYEAMKEALHYVREGNGPTFVEALTYRYRGHSMSDAELYRTKAEVEQYRMRDPILLLRKHMLEQGLIDEDSYNRLLEQVEQEVNEALEFAEKSPEPGISTLFDHITLERANG